MNNAVKAVILTGIAAAGIYGAATMEETIKSTFVEVPVVTLSREAFRNTVTANGTVYSSADNWYAKVYADESDIPSIALGQSAAVTGAAFPEEISGRVTEISDTAEKINGRTVVAVTVAMEDDCSILKNGYTAKASIYTNEAEILNVLPYEAIMQDDVSEYVYIFENNKAKRRNIKTGIELPDCAEITEGLNGSTQVIASPDKVAENDLIKVKEQS